MRLETEQLKKLGLKDCCAGDEVGIQAAGKIISVSSNQSAKGKEFRSVEIQIEAIDVVTEGEYEKGFDEAAEDD